MKTKLFDEVHIGDKAYWDSITSGPIPDKKLEKEDMYAGTIIWTGVFSELRKTEHYDLFEPLEWDFETTDKIEEITILMDEDWDLVVIEEEDGTKILCNYDCDPSGVICLKEDLSYILPDVEKFYEPDPDNNDYSILVPRITIIEQYTYTSLENRINAFLALNKTIKLEDIKIMKGRPGYHLVMLIYKTNQPINNLE